VTNPPQAETLAQTGWNNKISARPFFRIRQLPIKYGSVFGRGHAWSPENAATLDESWCTDHHRGVVTGFALAFKQ
jgi:hypothetical protein